MPVGLGNAAPASSPRTSLAPGETADLHKTGTGEMFLRTSRGPGEVGAAVAGGVSGAAATVSTRIGSGEATRPSVMDTALGWMTSKFEAFKGKLSDLGGKIGQVASQVQDSKLAHVLSEAKHDVVDFLKTRLGIQDDEPPLNIRQTADAARSTTTDAVADAAYASSLKSDWLKKVDVDLTSHASPETIAQVKSIVSAEIERTKVDITTFMRQDTAFKALMKNAANGFAINLAIDEHAQLPANKTVLLSQADFTGGNRALQSYPDLNKQVQIDNHNFASRSGEYAKGFFERMLGKDEQGARDIVASYPQSIKDIFRAAIEVVRSSDLSPAQVKALENTMMANFFLHILSTRIADVTLPTSDFAKSLGVPTPSPSTPTPLSVVSMTACSKVMQTFANSGKMQANAPLHPAVKEQLDTIEPQMQLNIKVMAETFYSQGAATV
ncbi:hypothetical protein [uncultured Methylobacterium sp.]|uniref:hypothetical protein n=1 Tax=uncultured Methylobacterium sp. TaxID=157278 RepID=UPI0035CC680D